MKTLTAALIALLLAGCAVDLERVPSQESDTPNEPGEELPLPDTEATAKPAPAPAPRPQPDVGGCEKLPYAWPWEPNWQACIDIESNSIPHVCDLGDGPPAEPSCFSIWENEWDYNQEETWCCCQTPSCYPN